MNLKLVATGLCVVLLVSCVAPSPPAGDLRVHPQTGKFKPQRDPDKPVLAFYGGVGLRKMPDGTWNGYNQQSPADVDYLIDRMRENGMTRIYASFQEENYPSKVIPRENDGIDYVALFVEKAHQNNIEVYGDIACFANFIATCENFTAAHPGMFTRDVNGVLDTHMLSPAYPQVREFKRRLLMEYVQNYPIDGIALDFIRYPSYGRDMRRGYGKHGYDEPALREFCERYGYDSGYQPAIDDPRWIEFKGEMVARFIREVREDLHARKVDLPVATFNSAIFGAADSLRTVHQDWQRWEREGLVDEHAPMLLMTHGMNNLTRATQDLLRIRRPGTQVMGAIFLDAGFDPKRGFVPTPQNVKDAARRLIKLGCDGLWFCRASEIEQYDLWPTVKEISQWSIRAIRAEDFDPLDDNLLASDPWTRMGAELDKFPIPLDLDRQQPSRITRAAQFTTAPYLSVESLEFSAAMDLSGATLESPARMQIELRYEDGAIQKLEQRWETITPELTMRIHVETDYDRHVLREARVSLILPPGAGTVQIKSLRLVRDPEL